MAINMKQMEKTEFVIGEYTFYVSPFPAMRSASISADVAKVIGPALGGLVSLIGGTSSSGSSGSDTDSILSSIDPQKAVSVLGDALGSLDGDEMERIIRRLLLDYHNIGVSGPYTNHKAVPLDLDTFNEVFCCEAQDIFVLCWDVINLNFKSFFRKVSLQFGNLSGNTETVNSNDMASST